MLLSHNMKTLSVRVDDNGCASPRPPRKSRHRRRRPAAAGAHHPCDVLTAAQGPPIILYEAVNQTDKEYEQFTVTAFVFKADGTPRARQTAPGRRTLEAHETKYSTMVLDGSPVEPSRHHRDRDRSGTAARNPNSGGTRTCGRSPRRRCRSRNSLVIYRRLLGGTIPLIRK